MLGKPRKPKEAVNDADLRSAELIAALETEERLTRIFQRALMKINTRDAGSPSVEDLLRDVEEARRLSGDALEKWRQAIRRDTAK